MPSQHDPSQGHNGKQLPPPSFTPTSGRPGRPERTPAIEIGSPNTGPQPTRVAANEPPTITDSQKIVKIRRSSDLPPTVTPRSGSANKPPVRTSSYAGGSSNRTTPQQSRNENPRVGAANDQLDATRIAPAVRHEESVPSFTPRHNRTMPEPNVQGQQSSRRISGQPQQSRSITPVKSSVGSNSEHHSPNQRTPLSTIPQSVGRGTAGRSVLPGQGSGSTKRRSKKRIVGAVVAVMVALMVAWPVGLLFWANGKLNHIPALSNAPSASGTTYLIAGSDSRGEDPSNDIKGARADTIMLLHVPESGPKALISLPRDIYVPIPGHDPNKINASFSFGGAPLLVETVEELTSMKVDHYVELGFSGVEDVVDAVGGVELCLDYKVNDKESKLKWKEPGCKVVDGETALAFARMRKADPLGDIGRAERQRQVVSAVAAELQSPTELLKPQTQIDLINAGTSALAVSDGTGFVDLAKMALAFRSASSEGGITGTPPITSLNYRPGGVGSAVRLDEEATKQFFIDIAAGSLEPGEYNNLR